MSLTNVYRDRLPRHSHNLSEARFFDMDMGVLTPIYVTELYPGDKIRITEKALLESRTLSAPLKNNITYREYWFFIPRRLMWKNWEKFIFGGKTGDFTADYPYAVTGNVSNIGYKSLWDYFGLPVDSSVTTTEAASEFTEKLKVDAMLFAAYQMIWKDWFRNENFSSDSFDFENAGMAWLNDGANSQFKNEEGTTVASLYVKRAAPWSRNYFTAALPFRQRGTANRVPLHGSAFLRAGVDVDMSSNSVVRNLRQGIWSRGSSGVDSAYSNYTIPIQSTDTVRHALNDPDSPAPKYVTGFPTSNLSRGDADSMILNTPNDSVGSFVYFGIDGSELSGFTITELRLLAKLQEFQEINARFGFRYIEGLRGHFGVSPTDARLDRPEFIGGFRQEVVVNEILQSSETNTTPLGTPAGRGISAGIGRIGSYYAEEHGLVMGIAAIMPQQIYTQGVSRMWTRRTKEEFFSPEFNGLSEQEIREKEIYATNSMSSEQLDTVFGFVPAWEELRRGKTVAVGNLRNPAQADLYAWTQARHFTSAPVLGENFLFGNQSNSNGGIRTDAWTTGTLASPFFVSLQHIVRKTSTVSRSGIPGITRI